MSHPIIHIGRYHGGSDDWRTPYRLFYNLHREFNFSLDGAATEHDALLPRFTDDIHNQSIVVTQCFYLPWLIGVVYVEDLIYTMHRRLTG
ncbi:DNA N-6-adenine-methyltransferase [Escherichia coli]